MCVCVFIRERAVERLEIVEMRKRKSQIPQVSLPPLNLQQMVVGVVVVRYKVLFCTIVKNAV